MSKYVQNMDSNIKKCINLITGIDSPQINIYEYHYQILAMNKHVIDEEDSHPVVYNLDPLKLFKDLNKCTANEMYDRYICANPIKCKLISNKGYRALAEQGYSAKGYCTGKRDSRGLKPLPRNVKNIFAFKNIVLDIDWHESAPDEIEEYTANFYDYYNDIFAEIPEPNIIHFTGRGMQLIYCLEMTSKKLAWLYEKTSHALFDAVNSKLKEYSFELGFAELDPSVTFNCAALIRMPGTINTCAYLPTYVKILSEKEWNLTDLFITVTGGPYVKTGKKFKTFIVKEKNYDDDFSAAVKAKIEYYRATLTDRIIYIEKIASQVQKGNRDIFLLAAYNTYIPLVGREEAEERTIQLNNRFNYPMRQREISRCIFRTHDSDNGSDWLWFTKETFFEYVGGNLKEAQEMGLFLVHKNKAEIKAKAEVARKKRFRDKYIVETFVEYENISKTAKICNVCRNTVRKILNNYKKLVEKLKKAKELILQRKICASVKRGRDIEKIMSKFHVSKDYIKEVVEYYANLRNSIYYFIWNDDAIPECVRQQIKDNGLWGATLDFVIRKIVEATGTDSDVIQIAINPELRIKTAEAE